MPSFARARQPATTSTLRQARGPIALPNYEPTSYPLNNNAQNALHDLQRNHKLESLKTRLQKANDHLTEAAADVNDRLHAKAVKQEKVKKRREAATSQGSNGVDDEEYDELKIATDDMTETLEQRVRNIIDAKAEVLNIETALKELDENATNNRGFIAPTQSTIGASQFRGSKRRRQGGGGENEDENETQKPSESAGLLGTLQRKIAEHTSEYQTSSLAQRYAAHNDYVGFKRIVHDARHPGDNAPPLPHASTWFPSEGGLTHDASFSRHGSTQIDDDDDLEVASERISTKCPLTLRVMKDPVQSTKCPHNFEKEAILEMINLSEVRDDEGRGRAGKKAMKCPQCEILLTAADLQPNPVLLRKIKRIEAAERARDEISDDEEETGNRSRVSNRDEITSSPPQTAQSFKRERMSQAASGRTRRDASMVPSTQLPDSTVLEVDGDDTSE